MPSVPSLRLSPEAAGILRLCARTLKRPCYLVGGAVRDGLLGRPTPDLDLALTDAKPAAKRLAAALKGAFVVLDEANDVYRIVLKEPTGGVSHLDVAALQGGDVASDLARRDFTINALAVPLADDFPEKGPPRGLLDPRGGLADLARRQVRAESDKNFREDPLRLLRAVRFAAQLDFEIEPKTLAMMKGLRQLVRRPAGERIRQELMGLLAVPGCSRWLKVMDEAELLTCLFEELEPARKCAEVYYGPGGVLKHSLEAAARADFLLRNLDRVFPGLAGPIQGYLARRSTEGNPFSAVLMLAVLLHDVAKPETARQVEGRLRFFGHDELGAKRASAILKRLRFSRDHMDAVALIVLHHLRPGNLAAGPAISDKAIYRFFRDVGEDSVGLLLACWADHASYLEEPVLLRSLKHACGEPGGPALAKVRPVEARKTIRHLQVIHRLLSRHFDEDKKAVPERVISGEDVMQALGLLPGPEVGRVLESVREAQAEGRVKDRRQALAFLASLRK